MYRAKAKAKYVPTPPEAKSRMARESAAVRWTKNTDPEARSAAARYAASRRWAGHTLQEKKWQPRQPRACRYCGDVVPMSSAQIRCSKDDCRLSYNAERMRPYNARRREQQRATTAQKIYARDIFERDGWTCGICGDLVDPTVQFPHPDSPSIDHIVPLGNGGHHIHDNVRCTHLRCNIRRGNRVEPAS